jgi:hypothetical protein
MDLNFITAIVNALCFIGAFYYLKRTSKILNDGWVVVLFLMALFSRIILSVFNSSIDFCGVSLIFVSLLRLIGGITILSGFYILYKKVKQYTEINKKKHKK